MFYKYARALVHTEHLIDEFHKMGISPLVVMPPKVDSLDHKRSEELKALTAHRMMILSEIAGALGYKLVPHEELRY